MYAKRNAALIICMAWANYRHRETVISILFHQVFLAGFFVARVFPVRIYKRSILCDDIILQRLLISRCRAYVDKLLCSAGKQPVIALKLRRNKTDKLTHTVKGHIAKLLQNIFFIIDVRLNDTDIFGQRLISVTSVEQIHLVAPARKQTGYRHTNCTCSADKQYFHTLPPCC